MHQTLNSTPAETKKAMVALLNARLADVLDLKAATRQAHWNVRGQQFIGLHELFDKFAADLDDHADTLAERAVALGGTALGTTQAVAKASMLAPYPVDIYAAAAHLKALTERYGALANALRVNIDEAEEAGDAGTADILTGLSTAMDKALWFLEASAEG